MPYLYGGGHAGYATFKKHCSTPKASNKACRVDCSGLVSFVIDKVYGTNWDWYVNASGYMAGAGSGHWHRILPMSSAKPGDIVTIPDHVEFLASGSGASLHSIGAHHTGTLDGTVSAGNYYSKAFRYK